VAVATAEIGHAAAQSENHLYLASQLELVVVSVAEPTAPRVAPDSGTSFSEWYLHRIHLSGDGDRLYVVRVKSTSIVVDAVDVQDPHAPRLLASHDVHHDPQMQRLLGDAVALEDHVAVVYKEWPRDAADRGDAWHLAVLNDGRSSALDRMADIEIPCAHKAVARGHVVFAYGCDSILAIDLRAPNEPVVVGELPEPSGVKAADLDGNVLVASSRDGRVLRFDVTDPTAMRRVSSIPVPNLDPATWQYQTIAASDGLVWLSAKSDGLHLLRH
jgi:hypothetical protein